MRVLGFTALITIILDRLSKLYAVDYLQLDLHDKIEILPPYLNFVMAWNRGINFGIGSSDSDITRWALIGIALVICVGLLVWGMRASGTLVFTSIGLVIGGALGNVWDRIQYGAVADFLNMSCCGIHNPYAFNVADVAIFAGALGLILFSDPKKDAHKGT